MLRWLIQNREWVFSGAGVAVAGAAVALFINRRRCAKMHQRACGSSTAIQAAGNVTIIKTEIAPTSEADLVRPTLKQVIELDPSTAKLVDKVLHEDYKIRRREFCEIQNTSWKAALLWGIVILLIVLLTATLSLLLSSQK